MAFNVLNLKDRKVVVMRRLLKWLKREFEPVAMSDNLVPFKARDDGLVRHSFIVMNSKTDEMCIFRGCGQTRELGNHYTQEDVEKILERRRAIMPGYDEALKEWLS